jgi:BMFP domain-containing protein YqiC
MRNAIFIAIIFVLVMLLHFARRKITVLRDRVAELEAREGTYFAALREDRKEVPPPLWGD